MVVLVWIEPGTVTDKIKTSYDNIKIQDNREHRGQIIWRTKELSASVHRLVASCKIDAANAGSEAAKVDRLVECVITRGGFVFSRGHRQSCNL